MKKLKLQRDDNWIEEVLREQREKKRLYEQLKAEGLPIPQFLKDEFEQFSFGFGDRT